MPPHITYVSKINLLPICLLQNYYLFVYSKIIIYLSILKLLSICLILSTKKTASKGGFLFFVFMKVQILINPLFRLNIIDAI